MRRRLDMCSVLEEEGVITWACASSTPVEPHQRVVLLLLHECLHPRIAAAAATSHQEEPTRSHEVSLINTPHATTTNSTARERVRQELPQESPNVAPLKDSTNRPTRPRSRPRSRTRSRARRCPG